MATFDSLAPSYDKDFTQSPIGLHLRNRVHRRLLELWQEGDSILEVGCGTGEDAHFLGSHGIHVTATDASEEMRRIASTKNQSLNNIQIQELNLNQLPDNQFKQPYTGVLSNFGALNCIDDWRPLSLWLSSRVQQGGTLAFAIMSPLCICETLWHGLHLDIKTASRRWHKTTTFTPDDATSINIAYPTIKRLTKDFAPYFQRTQVYPLGLCLPPSDVYPVIEKRQNLLKWLKSADDKLATLSQLALFADHYWIEFERM